MRYWTVLDARAFLPRLRELILTIRHAAHLPQEGFPGGKLLPRDPE